LLLAWKNCSTGDPFGQAHRARSNGGLTFANCLTLPTSQSFRNSNQFRDSANFKSVFFCVNIVLHSLTSHPGGVSLPYTKGIHSRFFVHFPIDMDLKKRVRRVRPFHCAPQMLLKNAVALWLQQVLYAGRIIIPLCSYLYLVTPFQV
jgi:hypothetical protein